MLHVIRAALASGFCLFACFASKAEPAPLFNPAGRAAARSVPVVVFGAHPRLTAEQFASENRLDPAT